MKNILTIILMCTMVLAITVGCNTNEQQPEPIDGNEDIIENEEIEQVEEDEEIEEIEQVEGITEKGTYVGQIDPTSIEVMIEGEPRAFMNYEMSQLLEGIEEGDEIEINYIEGENGQLMIQSIKKVQE